MVKRNHLVRHPFWPNEFDLRRERSLTQRPFGNRQIAIMKNSAEPTRLEPRAAAELSPTASKIPSKR